MEAFDRLRGQAQRTVALAHQVDAQLELPETAEAIAAARALLAALDRVGARLRPVITVAAIAPPAEAPPLERPLAIGNEVTVQVSSTFHRRARITAEHVDRGERAFTLEWARGVFRAFAFECQRASP